MKYLIGISLAALLAAGCGNSMKNTAPELSRVVEDLAVKSGSSITLDLTVVEAYDANGDDLSLVVGTGRNYTVSGNVITPVDSFIGDIAVPLRVSDGSLESHSIDIVISVVKRIEIMPLRQGFVWNYADTGFADSSYESSTFTVGGRYAGTAGGWSTGDMYVGAWTSIDSVDLTYLYADSTDFGNYFIGAIAGTDSLIDPSLRIKYPAAVGESWAFSPLVYNITDTVFETDTTVHTMTCTDDEVYVTVPAGIFKCVEYSYSGHVAAGLTKRVSSVAQFSDATGSAAFVAGYDKTIKLYYCPGVGYVQYLMYANNVLVKKKALSTYTVVEE